MQLLQLFLMNYDFTEFEEFENNYEILSSDEIEEYLERKGENEK